MISPAHNQLLQLKYGLPESLVISLGEQGEISSLTPQEVRLHLGRQDIDSSGFLLRYPGNGASTIRLDSPPINGDGKPQKYRRRPGEPNALFNHGVDLAQAGELWIVEGELKALCGYAQGLPIVGLSGIWNWRTATEETSLLAEGERLKDEEALLPELAQVNWDGKKINLLYDSDITPGHKAYDAFPRLAEQLYRLGAGEVRIISLPPVAQGQKTGLDEFILAKGPEEALQDLQAMKDRKEPYLPWRDGGQAYAERLIKSENPEDKRKAAIAILGAKGKYVAGDWLKKKGLLQRDITPLLQEAKEKLAQLQAQAKPKAGSQAGGDLPELGPEYNTPKALLKDHIEQFVIDNLGRLNKILLVDMPGKDEVILKPTPLCNFVAWPIRDIIKDDGLSTERFIEFQGILQGGALFPPVKISGKDFQEMKWLIEAWGVRAAIKPRLEQEVRYALQLMAQAGIPESTIFTHLGWRKINGSWAFLHAGGAIGSEAVEVEISDRLRRYSLPERGEDITAALRASLSLLELGPKRIMYPLYALIWLTPLCEPFRQAGIEPGFVTYLWGKSGTFKSSLIAVLLCHYGDFGPKTLPASFKDTSFSVEEIAFQAKDILLVVDDLYPAINPKEKSKMEGALEYLSRNQGDRQGRGRLKSSIKLTSGHPPRGLALCSGEIMPLSGSSLARSFVLHILKDDINEGKLTQAQAQKGLLPQAMRGYLEYLAPQLDTLPSDLLETFENLRDKAKRESKTRTRHRRIDETITSLFLGFNIFINFAVSQEALSQEEGAKHLQEAWKALNEAGDELAQEAEREEPTKRFFEALQELQTQGRIYFSSMEGALPEMAEQTFGAVRIGWGPDEKGVYYLLYGPAWEQVVRYLQAQEVGLPLSKNDLLDYMEQKGLLDRSQGGRRSIVKKIAGKQVRVIPLLEKALSLKEEKDNV